MTETVELNNGVTMPRLGLGTWLIPDDAVAAVVRTALEAGYRHLDTAQAYGNERGVGEGLRASGLARESVFVTTKLAAEAKDYASATAAIDGSLTALGLAEIDLMLIHSPEPWADWRNGEHYFAGNLEAWRALEDAQAAGKLRAIGVSNFEPVDLENLLTHGRVRPAVNQVLAHIGNWPRAVIDDDRAHGIVTEAYSPVAHGAMLNEPTIVAMAARYGVGVAQLALRFCLQKGLVPLPKSTSPAHLAANLALDFEIAPADMATLEALRFADYGQDRAFPVYSGK
ncbi:aldo/keto reductase [Lacticaseibacillus absianus]|uniref:aldo/keto reductase n=1 Tax=Lacticaseibacillus absianus TaxID=2729623 RepID=UPI0015C7FF09|nr:aldo/keto reductase [Lacticaseibacillus absianus]